MFSSYFTQEKPSLSPGRILKKVMFIIQEKEGSNEETGEPEVLHSGLRTPKSKRSRVVQLPGKVAHKINQLIEKDGRFIFGGNRSQHEDHLTKTFNKILKLIDKDLTLHCLRHTFIT